jgi:hypothetical protein
VTIHCNFAIPFVEWGLEDPSILMFKVSKEVDIDVKIKAHLSWLAATAMPGCRRSQVAYVKRFVLANSTISLPRPLSTALSMN